MTSMDFNLVKHWFEQLADLAEPERTQFMREHPDIDDDTRYHLMQLLNADVQLAGHTARSAIKSTVGPVLDNAMIGQRIGAYTLDRSLGRGGMGNVFLAHRADGSIEQQVAIKIVRPEVLDQHTIARFHLERQVLALLKHPHIATLLDAGALEDGSPYVVMEYIEGETITIYANSQQLGLRARLDLFLKVCDAVAFAHRNLIVHRDLKPGNVLVSADGQPKLLDFGIAKPLIGAIGAIDVQDTSAAQRFFSPHHAAPEQLRNEPITPTCDVYGLGVLLYELLTGNKPLDLAGLAPGEMEHRVLTEDPRPPSQRGAIERDLEVGADYGEDAPRSGSSRNAAPAAASIVPSAALKGDLDAIALMCLRKRASDRYATVEALSADVRAYLDGFPVRARRGGRAYSLRRFLARHRLVVAASVAMLVVVTLGALTWLRQYRATIEQRSRADQMTALILQAIEAADPSGGNAGNLKVRELFQRISETAMSDPAVLAEQSVALLAPLAKIQSRLELSAEALKLIEHVDVRSLSRAEQQSILRARADALQSLGRFKEVEPLVEQGLALAYDSESLSQWKLTETFVDHKLGRASESLAKLRSMSLIGLSRKLRIEVLQQRARVYLDTGRTDKAREALQIVMGQMDYRPENNMALLSAHSALYELNLMEYKFKDAESDLMNQLSVIEQVYGKNSNQYVTTLVKQADLLARMDGRGDRYREFSVRANAMNRFQEVSGLYHPDMAKLEFDLAVACLKNGDGYRAILALETAIMIAEKVNLPSDYNLLMIRSSLAARLVLDTRFAEARSHAERAAADARSHAELRSSPHHLLAILVVAIADFQQAPSQRGRDGVVNAYRAFADSKSTPSVQVMTRELPAVITQLGITLE